MHTVVETPANLAAAKAAGMTQAEREAAIALIAESPGAGDIIVGTGGCRKVRVAGRGKGKSGGYRLITFFVHEGVPVFLLTVFSKGERADLSKVERNALATLTTTLVQSLGPRAVSRSKA
jgi:hypothetical protein